MPEPLTGAQRVLFDGHLGHAMAVAGRIAAARGLPLDADEIDQAGRVGLLRAVRSHQPGRSPFAAWLGRLVLAELLDCCRRADHLPLWQRRRVRRGQRDDVRPHRLSTLSEERLPDPAPPPGHDAEQDDQVRHLLRGLTPRQRLVVLAVVVGGREQRHVAAGLGVDPSRVCQILRAARAYLRETRAAELAPT